MDPEHNSFIEKHLFNTTVTSIAWHGVTVTVKEDKSKRGRAIIQNVEGIVESGLFLTTFFPSAHANQN